MDNNLSDSPKLINGSSAKIDDNVVRPNFTGDDGRKRSIERAEVLYPSEWKEPAPPISWAVDGVFPVDTVAMVSGDGGVGKSLLLQMLITAAAIGKPWLGLPTKPCRTFGVFCEDSPEELKRRQEKINSHYGIEPDDLIENVAYMSRVGMDNLLMIPNRRSGQLQQTTFLNQLRQAVLVHGADILVIDTVADTFGGNEIARNEVRQFIQRLRRLATEMGGHGLVILTQHPSVMGMNSGTGISGSTAWNNSVRSRIYLTKEKGVTTEIGERDNNCRILQGMKNNYGAIGDDLKLRWENGVFIRTDIPTAPTGVLGTIAMENDILKVASQLIGNGVELSAHHSAKNSLVNLVRKEPVCKRYPFHSVCTAQERMLAQGRLIKVGIGPLSRRKVCVRPKDGPNYLTPEYPI